MTDKVVVLVTCGSSEEAERIARALVEARLAACVNITGPVRSIYRWEGKLNDDQEVLLVIKTSRSLFDQVRHAGRESAQLRGAGSYLPAHHRRRAQLPQLADRLGRRASAARSAHSQARK